MRFQYYFNRCQSGGCGQPHNQLNEDRSTWVSPAGAGMIVSSHSGMFQENHPLQENQSLKYIRVSIWHSLSVGSAWSSEVFW